MKKEVEKIVCPKCGAEYLPAEIYFPNCFFGTPLIVDRDGLNHIVEFSGTSMNLSEKFDCDFCGCTFEVKAKISFETKIDKKEDFSSDYKTILKKESLFLDEE